MYKKWQMRFKQESHKAFSTGNIVADSLCSFHTGDEMHQICEKNAQLHPLTHGTLYKRYKVEVVRGGGV